MSGANQSLLVPLDGNVPVIPDILITPTAQRTAQAATVGWQNRRRYTITSSADEAIYNHAFPLDIGRTDGFVTAGLMLSSGDDIRLVINGLEVARSLNSHNTTSNTLVWFVIPFLDAGGSMTVELWYGNPSAGDPPELSLDDGNLPASDIATTGASRATDLIRPYLIDRTSGNAGKGGWGLSSGTQEPVPDFSVPDAWQLANTRPSSDDRRQATWQSYVATGTKYQARFDATRARLEALVFDRDTGADGVSLRSGAGIASVRCDLRYTNLAIGDTDTTPIGQLVILARSGAGDEWSVVHTEDTLQATETTIATATYTMPTGTKEVAFAVWPQDGLVVDQAARPDRYVYGAWFSVLELTYGDVLTQSGPLEDDWTPADDAPLVWLKADAISGLTDGANVSQWDDQSGNDRHAVQATAGKQPTYQTNEINSLPAVRFDGTETMLISGLPTQSQPYTIAFVAKDNSATGRFLSSANVFFQLSDSGNDAQVSAGSTVTYGNDLVTGTAWHVHSVYFNGASSEGSVDGTAATVSPGTNATNTTLRIAASTDTPDNPITADFLEIVVFAGTKDAGWRRRLEGYLAHRANLDANLPAAHPYKSAAPVQDEIYEAAFTVRVGGGGADTAVPPYTAVYLGNAQEDSGVGTPRAGCKIGEQVIVFGETKRTEVWDDDTTAKIEAVPIPAVSGVDGVLSAGATVERPATDWLPLVPVTNPLENPDFAAGITDWTVSSVSGLITDTRSWDSAIANTLDGSSVGALKHVISGSSLGSGETALIETPTMVSGLDYLPVGNRQNVQVSADFRTSNVQLVQRLLILYYDASLTLLETNTEEVYAPASLTWQRRCFAAAVPEGAVYWRARILLHTAVANQNGSVYADRVRINDADLVFKDVNIGGITLAYRFYERTTGS